MDSSKSSGVQVKEKNKDSVKMDVNINDKITDRGEEIIDRKEEVRFNILLIFDIFLISLIIYLSNNVNNGSQIADLWVYATVITLSIVVVLRTVATFFSGNTKFLMFKNFSQEDFVKVLAYVCLLLSVIFQLYAVYVLL